MIYDMRKIKQRQNVHLEKKKLLLPLCVVHKLYSSLTLKNWLDENNPLITTKTQLFFSGF